MKPLTILAELSSNLLFGDPEQIANPQWLWKRRRSEKQNHRFPFRLRKSDQAVRGETQSRGPEGNIIQSDDKQKLAA